jgi:hypothetical protein
MPTVERASLSARATLPVYAIDEVTLDEGGLRFIFTERLEEVR